jgi:pyrroloquinoline quinone (PQQ) biosynthesis protein C
MDVVARLDAVVDDFCRRTAFFHEPLTPERARAFVKQHRLNTRQRNSVLKLSVATNCPDWDIRLKIIESCSQEIIADHEFGGGKAHWEILEELGLSIGMDIEEIRSAKPTATTQLCWLAWETLTRNRNWLEGLVANTCAERANVPGYGDGDFRRVGFSGVQREHWRRLFGLNDAQLVFWKLHEDADIEHSNLGWQTIAVRAESGGMADAVVDACRVNLLVWERYFNGIGEEGDRVAAEAKAEAVG